MELEATVEISLAFHVWYSLSSVETSKHTLDLWKVVLRSFVPHIAVELLDTDIALQAFVQLPAACTMSAGHDSNTAQPCLRLLQLFMQYHHVPADSMLAGHIKNIKRSAAVLQTSHKLKTKSKNRLYILRLQQKVLMLKFAELLASVKQHTNSADLASAALWQYVAEELYDDDQFLPMSLDPPLSSPVQPAAVETELLNKSLLLVELLISLVQLLSRTVHHSLAMCITVIHQIPYRQPQCSLPSVLFVDHEMIRQGALMKVAHATWVSHGHIFPVICIALNHSCGTACHKSDQHA